MAQDAQEQQTKTCTMRNEHSSLPLEYIVQSCQPACQSTRCVHNKGCGTTTSDHLCN